MNLVSERATCNHYTTAAQAILSEMTATGCVPSRMLYVRLIASLARETETFEDALRVFWRMMLWEGTHAR